MCDLKGTILDVFPHKVVVHINVLRVCMETGFLCECDHAGIVDKDFSSQGWFGRMDTNVA